MPHNETLNKKNTLTKKILFPDGNWISEEEILNKTCDRLDIMGSIVSNSAPYLYPFLVEYSLIAAAVVFIMWRHIGRNPR